MKLCVTYSDEKTMITIGDVCPLFFNTLKYEYANECSFRQCFDLSDGILLQIFCDGGETPSAYLNDKIKSSSSSISFKTYSVNEDVVMFYTYIYSISQAYLDLYLFYATRNSKTPRFLIIEIHKRIP